MESNTHIHNYTLRTNNYFEQGGTGLGIRVRHYESGDESEVEIDVRDHLEGGMGRSHSRSVVLASRSALHD